MKQANALASFILVIILAACANRQPQIVSRSDSLGGVQDGPRWATLKFLNFQDKVKKDRDAVSKIIKEHCLPKNYKVVDVSEQSNFVRIENTYDSKYSVNAVQRWTYIKFECVDGTQSEK